ncbi:Transmembrane Fragile-X-F-associated protein [Aphelenchoides avenae]|nr:Transmembrane Fragile-X-F-associated protein [Aphelenchus avenae]
MCFCTLEHILLVMFQLLCCYKLEFAETPDGKQMSWLVVCTPLFVQSFMAMIVSVWSIRHDKTFEFEMFFSLNVVQFVFVAFKLDQALHWNWVIVFVPAWVVFSLCLVGTLYSLILSIFLSRSLHVLAAHRRSHIYNSACHLLLIIPLLTFFLMLSNKLDAAEWLHDQGHTPYTLVASPLWLSLFLLLFMSFGSKTGNTWWFAMRKPFCNFIFDAFPCLQQYANISYRFGHREEKIPPPPRRSVSGGNGFHGEHIQMLPQEAISTSIPEGVAGRTIPPSTKTIRVCSIEMPD